MDILIAFAGFAVFVTFAFVIGTLLIGERDRRDARRRTGR